MTEQQLANEILGWAKTFGWLAFHVRNSGMGGMTQVQGDKGFPDLILARQHHLPRIIAAELKVGKAGTQKGDPRPEQTQWLEALKLGSVGTIETYVWRPYDLPNIINILRREQ